VIILIILPTVEIKPTALSSNVNHVENEDIKTL